MFKSVIYISFFVLLFVALVPVQSFAQTKRVKGSAMIRIEKNFSYEEARTKVYEMAVRDALASEFGTTIMEGNTMQVENTVTGQEADTEVKFKSLTDSYVNGEWLGELKPPKYKDYFKDGYQWIKCTVWGTARQKERLNVALEIKTLRCLDLKCENTRFQDGDDFFVYFKTPVKGFVSIYLDDGERVQCLLPYSQMRESFLEVLPDQPYYFFSSQHDYLNNPQLVDEYVLAAEKSMDLNRLYMIFSKNAYDKAGVQTAQASINEQGVNWKLPKSMSSEQFKKWLMKNRSHDELMQVEFIDITIEKP